MFPCGTKDLPYKIAAMQSLYTQMPWRRSRGGHLVGHCFCSTEYAQRCHLLKWPATWLLCKDPVTQRDNHACTCCVWLWYHNSAGFLLCLPCWSEHSILFLYSDDDTSHWPRIVRPVLSRSRHVICRLCCPGGQLEEAIITRAKHGRSVYKA